MTGQIAAPQQGVFRDLGGKRWSVKAQRWGALGNGTRDDTVSLNKLLTYLATPSNIKTGIVDYPVGTYLTSSALAAQSDITVEGAGWTSVLKAAGSSTHNLLTIGATIARFTVRDMAFDGNGTTGNCVSLTAGATDILFEHCKFTNSAGSLVSLGAGTRITFRDCTFVDPSGTARFVDCDDGVTFQNCHWIQTGTGVGRFVLLQGDDVSVLGCDFDGHNYTGSGIYISSSASPKRLKVEGCTFQHVGTSQSAAIFMDSTAGTPADITIVGNVFRDCGVDSSGNGTGAAIAINAPGTPTSRGLTIAGNTIVACGEGILVAQSWDVVSITGNTVKDQIYDGNNGNTSAMGIECQASHPTITGNTVYKARKHGIYIGGLGSVAIAGVVSGNVVMDTQAAGTTAPTGISVTGSDILVENNIVIGSLIASSIGINLHMGSEIDANISQIRVIGNKVKNWVTGIGGSIATHTLTDIVVALNDLGGNTTNLDAAVIDAAARNPRVIRQNIGYATEASGTGAIANGATSTTITHGLDYTPSDQDVVLIPTNNPTNDPGWLYADTFGATTFVVRCRADPGATTLTFSWAVRR